MDAQHLAKSLVVRASILALDLRRHPRFDALSPEEFAAIYNGIGPDKWPETLRDVMTAVYDGLEELPGVHDVDFFFSDGTSEGFAATLNRWHANGKTLLAVKFPLWQVWRWRTRSRAWAKIMAAYLALRQFSRPIYNDAAKSCSKQV